MLKDRHIAFFIDVDNVALKSENYFNVMDQLNSMGTVLFGKIYGAGERKHKEIYADAALRGYKTERPMRIKRRGRKEFDSRIFVDVVDSLQRAPAIDAVCIVACPTDLVYLYSYLRSRGIKIIALDNADDASCSFVDEVVDLGVVYELKLPNSAGKAVKPAAVAAVPQQEAPRTAEVQSADRTDELLKEIERLRAEASTQRAARPEQPAQPQAAPQGEPEVQPDAQQEAQPQPETPEQPAEETVEEPAPQANIVDEARSLLERIDELKKQTEQERPAQSAPQQEPQAKEPEQEPEQVAAPQSFEPVAQPQPEPVPQPAPQAAPVANDSDLIKRIEEIRRDSKGGDEDFLAEIRKLLDGLE